MPGSGKSTVGRLIELDGYTFIDTDAEIDFIVAKCRELGVNTILSNVWAKGGEGGIALAEEVIRLCEQPNEFEYCYDEQLGIVEKIWGNILYQIKPTEMAMIEANTVFLCHQIFVGSLFAKDRR